MIGPGDLNVVTSSLLYGGGTAPEDYVERAPSAGLSLEPASLYEDQLARRLAP